MSKTIEQLVKEVSALVKEIRVDMYLGRITASYQAVRINPDGEVYRTIEASRCYSEGEYYVKVPHNSTAWEWANAINWSGSEQDTPLDAQGDWVGDEPPVSDEEAEEIERRITEWAEAGNYSIAMNA